MAGYFGRDVLGALLGITQGLNAYQGARNTTMQQEMNRARLLQESGNELIPVDPSDQKYTGFFAPPGAVDMAGQRFRVAPPTPLAESDLASLGFTPDAEGQLPQFLRMPMSRTQKLKLGLDSMQSRATEMRQQKLQDMRELGESKRNLISDFQRSGIPIPPATRMKIQQSKTLDDLHGIELPSNTIPISIQGQEYRVTPQQYWSYQNDLRRTASEERRATNEDRRLGLMARNAARERQSPQSEFERLTSALTTMSPSDPRRPMYEQYLGVKTGANRGQITTQQALREVSSIDQQISRLKGGSAIDALIARSSPELSGLLGRKDPAALAQAESSLRARRQFYEPYLPQTNPGTTPMTPQANMGRAPTVPAQQPTGKPKNADEFMQMYGLDQ